MGEKNDLDLDQNLMLGGSMHFPEHCMLSNVRMTRVFILFNKHS